MLSTSMIFIIQPLLGAFLKPPAWRVARDCFDLAHRLEKRMRYSVAFILPIVIGLLPIAHRCPANEPAEPRILGEGQILEDCRHEPLKDLHGYFPFHVPSTQEAWQRRSDALKRQVQVATGLWPMPERTPLKPVIHGRIERDGFTVEQVYFESLPGFFVTGQLFRPAGKAGPFPAVLCPHGHGGRLQDAGARVRVQITRGEERFEASGRFPKLARCAQLARMGCVTLIIDMIGYADNMQLSRQLAHGFANRRPEMENANSWGLYSTQAELRCQSILGMQTWNCIRALDFLCALPDVDSSRIGVTGGSGGGTQTILLGALDSRPTVAFPQGMVSTSMQGGCTCENCCLLRIGTGNVELAALFAPKPQAMTTADDWTKEMMTRGFPELKSLYALLGRPDHVACTPYLHFPHNYNYVTRARMYEWFNKYLRLRLDEPIVEEDYKLLAGDELTVWDEEHPQPARRGDDFERELVAYLTQASERQIGALEPTDENARKTYREVVGGAVEAIIGRTSEDVGPIKPHRVATIDRGSYDLGKCRLAVPRHQEQVLAIRLFPKEADWNGQVVLWLTGAGKQRLFEAAAKPTTEVAKLLSAGYSVVTADLVGQGEAALAGAAEGQNRAVANPREYAGYTYGYNTPLLAQQVHDVLTLVEWLRSGDGDIRSVQLVGTGAAGVVVAAAGAVIKESTGAAAVVDVAIETDGFRFRQLSDYRDARFLPGIVKYGGLPALLALNASRNVRVFDPQPEPPLLTKAFAALPGKMTWTAAAGSSGANGTHAAVVDWLTR